MGLAKALGKSAGVPTLLQGGKAQGRSLAQAYLPHSKSPGYLAEA